MAKRATVQPIWLDRMLVQWGIRSLKLESSALGYPRICPMLKEGIPTQARSHEPTGYSDEDFRQLQRAIDKLEKRHVLVITRAYKPWAAKAMELELQAYGLPPKAWLLWLAEAASAIEASMAREVMSHAG